ncbi:V-type proton ATPase subunit F-like [Euwallacea similis]|uniref:V-type proton ATPase subunit F-like n=1 Tax=Euwallacea similis TaxID=1736056 RepID=UPI00344F1DB8
MENYMSKRSDENSHTNVLQDLFGDESSQVLFSDSTDSIFIGESKLIAIVGDEDTCVCFILAGIGQTNEDSSQNFVIVDQQTEDLQLELKVLDLLERPDIGLVLITKEAAEKITRLINKYKCIDPVVLIIPGHNGPFEIELPPAIKKIEEKAYCKYKYRRSSNSSSSSITTNESVHAESSKKWSTHSLKLETSSTSLKL